ncbi:MAG: CHASE2 domain-containing protein [Phormidesmis sp.]
MKSSCFRRFTWLSASWKQINLGVKAGSVAALAIIAGLGIGGDRPLELMAYNQLFRLRGPIQWSPEIVVIGIDEPSLQQIGQFPWPREIHTALLQQLTPAQPSAIVFDIVFADPDPADQALAEAMTKQQKVVLATGWTTEGTPVAPNETLANAAIAIGHIHKTPELDGVTRSFDALQPADEGFPALGISAVQTHALSQNASLNNVIDTRPAPIWINWPGPSDQLAHYSYAEVVNGEVSPEIFSGKIVLIGATATGLDDLRTPFDHAPPTSGVYLHAATISNILQQNFLQVPSRHWTWVILALGGPVLGWRISRYRYRTQLMCCGGVAVGWGVLSLAALSAGYWIPVVWPICLGGFTLGANIVGTYREEEQQLRGQLKTLKNVYSDLSVESSPLESHATTQPFSLVQAAADLTAVSTKVSQLIWQDELTQLNNRRRFDQRLEIEWLRAIHSRSEIAILMCDIDYFKGFNDTYGHLEGDMCLQQVAATIDKTISRPNDLVARYGGEEFIVMLPNTDAKGAIHIAKTICSAVKSRQIIHNASQVSDYVTVSIGVAVDVPNADSLSQVLVNAADQALYSAKAMGRDRAALYYDTKRYPTTSS